jgi:amino-acid N-acetyltransferase
MPIRIERATVEDRENLVLLLTQNNLPIEGLSEALETAFVARDGDHVVGSAALEIYDDGALLRSVAVAPDRQGRGIGRAITEEVIRLATELQIPALFLLTTTAEQFFPKFGFERIVRSAVPPGVRASLEFTSACPATAVVMRKRL